MCNLPTQPSLTPVSETAIDVHELRTTGRPAGERTRMHAPRRDDEEAFRRIAEEHRPALHLHCYRMLGSVHDAEDAFQETMLRAWRGLPRFQGRSSLRSWLYRIATNVCIDAIKRRPASVPPFGHGHTTELGPSAPALREPIWIKPHRNQDLGVEDAATAPEACYERRESAESAFIAALEHLPVRQRNVLILRDVLGFSAKEAAEILKTTVVAINSALQRARRVFDKGLHERSRQTTQRSLFDKRIRDLVERFVNAVERGDIDTILALLAEDATLAMTPSRELASGGRCEHRLAASSSVAAVHSTVPRTRDFRRNSSQHLTPEIRLREARPEPAQERA
jgi:RNA polymerase sigma-70 factor (ECF subfamily)